MEQFNVGGMTCAACSARVEKAVNSVDGIDRIRLGSLEPEKMTDEMLMRLAALPKFCPSFHLSLQSGCNRTLKRRS